MNDPRPIGIFDSGVGGLTVARAVAKRLPRERIVYFADTAHVPYGPRPLEAIQRFALAICDFLIQRDAKMILMGCNMSSAVALRLAKERFDIPILGTIASAVESALPKSRNHRIGLIATEGTVASGAYQAAFASVNSGTRLFAQACPRLVPLVEAGAVDSPQARSAAGEYLQPLQDNKIDTLILGCTHYPFLRQILQEILGEDVSLVDPAEAMAQHAEEILGSSHAFADHPHPYHTFYASGDGQPLLDWSRRGLGLDIAEIKQGPVFE